MVSLAANLLAVLMLALASGPLVACILARRRWGRGATARTRWVKGYYVAAALLLAVHFWAISAHYAQIHRTLFQTFLFAQLAITLAGPLLAAEVLRAAEAARRCTACRREWNGALPPDCPECGAPTNAVHWRRDGWPRVKWLWLGAIVFIFAALSLRERFDGRYCPRCARQEYTHSYALNIPLTGWTLVATAPQLIEAWSTATALTAYFDPHDACTHDWRRLGRDTGGVGYADACMLRNPLDLFWGRLPAGFDAFVATHPQELARCREDLSAGHPCDALLAAATPPGPRTFVFTAQDLAADEGSPAAVDSNGIYASEAPESPLPDDWP